MTPLKSVLLAAVLVFGLQGAAGQRPTFAGKWVIDADRTAAAAKDAAAYPTTEMEITMDEKTMSIASKGPQGTVTNVYNLDGTPSATGTSRAVGPSGASGSRAVAPSTAKWQGSSLVITTNLYNGPSTMTYTLEGEYLRVEFAAPKILRRAVYRKAQF